MSTNLGIYHLEDELRNLNDQYPFGIVAIGRVAVLLRVMRSHTILPTKHNDVEFFVSAEQLGSLRDQEIVSTDEKRRIREIRRKRYSIVLHLENDSQFKIPYEDIERHSEIIDGVRVAANEHLLILELNALVDNPDAAATTAELFDLVLEIENPDAELFTVPLDEEHILILRSIERREITFGKRSMTEEEAMDRLRRYEVNVERIVRASRKARAFARERQRRLVEVAPKTIPVKRRRTIPANFDLMPARVAYERIAEPLTTIEALCVTAGIEYRAIETNPPRVATASGTGNLRALDGLGQRVYMVDRTQFAAETPKLEALRILEVIAHSFHDRAVRESVRGIFR